MSNLKPFERLNKLTNEKEAYVSTSGELLSISDEPLHNKVSDKPYYRFTAKIMASNGKPNIIGGQLYEALIPYLGKRPEVGDKMEFNARVSDLREKYNTRWGIGGSSVDSVDDLLMDLDKL